MLEQSHVLETEGARAPNGAGIRRWAAVALAAVATVAFLIRVPATLEDLHRRASFNDRETPSGRLIQGADGLAIQNEFLIQALSLVPPHATYVVEQPVSEQVARTYGIPRTTLLALRGYVRFLLLPRREARPARAQYLLCYACDTDPFDKRGMQRLWSDPKGLVIGRLNP